MAIDYNQDMANPNTERSKKRIQRHKDAGFKQTMVFIAAGDSTLVQKYAYMKAKQKGINKP